MEDGYARAPIALCFETKKNPSIGLTAGAWIVVKNIRDVLLTHKFVLFRLFVLRLMKYLAASRAAHHGQNRCYRFNYPHIFLPKIK